MSKTNAVRILDKLNIPYILKEYPLHGDDFNAVLVAESIGQNPEQVFKTLIAEGDKTGYHVFCIPAPYELDLKKAAKASGNKSVVLLPVKDLFETTGYIRGGCSPIGLKKPFPVFIDETALLFETVFVSAGMRGMQMGLTPMNLQKAANAVFTDLMN